MSTTSSQYLSIINTKSLKSLGSSKDNSSMTVPTQSVFEDMVKTVAWIL